MSKRWSLFWSGCLDVEDGLSKGDIRGIHTGASKCAPRSLLGLVSLVMNRRSLPWDVFHLVSCDGSNLVNLVSNEPLPLFHPASARAWMEPVQNRGRQKSRQNCLNQESFHRGNREGLWKKRSKKCPFHWKPTGASIRDDKKNSLYFHQKFSSIW